MALPTYDLTSVDLATCDLYYGTVMLEGGALQGVEGDTYFAPPLVLDQATYYVFEVDYEIVFYTGRRIDAFSLRTDGDAETSRWEWLARQNGSVSEPLGTVGTYSFVIGPGKENWNRAFEYGENRLIINAYYTKVTGLRYREATSEFPGGISASTPAGQYSYTFIERLRLNSADTANTDDGYQVSPRVCKISDDVLVTCLWTGNDHHFQPVRAGADGTVTRGPVSIWWNAGAPDDLGGSDNWAHPEYPADPLLPKNWYTNSQGQPDYYFTEGAYDPACIFPVGDDRFVVVNSWDELYAGSDYVAGTTYSIDLDTLLVTRVGVTTVPRSYADAGWGDYVKACPWGQGRYIFVVPDYTPRLVAVDCDTGVVNSILFPDVSTTYYDVAATENRLVMLRTDSVDTVVAMFYSLSSAGIGSLLGELTLPGSKGIDVGDGFPSVFLTTVGDQIAVITSGPDDVYAKKYGDILLYWVDPVAMTASAPITVVAGTAAQQGLRGGLYLSQYTSARSIDPMADGRVLVSWFDYTIGNLMAAFVSDDVVETFPVIGQPTLTNLSMTTNVRWDRVDTVGLENGVVATVVNGPGYRYAGEGDYAAHLSLGFPPQFLRGGFRESRRAFSAT